MTVRSQNGWTADDDSLIASYTIPGTSEKIALRKGDASVILLDLAGYLNALVGIVQKTLDEWGYARRNVRGSSDVSNHASGTAEDIDAQKHPLGAENTWTDSQERQIELRLSRYYDDVDQVHVVRWGRDYHGRKDEMHFELVGTPAQCKRVADKIRAGHLGDHALSYLVGREPFWTPSWYHRSLHAGMEGEDAGRVRVWLGMAKYPAKFTTVVRDRIKAKQHELGQYVSGQVGEDLARVIDE